MYKITILHQKSYPMKERGNTERVVLKKKMPRGTPAEALEKIMCQYKSPLVTVGSLLGV